MPYIESKGRTAFEPHIEALKPDSAGELNYVLSRICVDYLHRKGKRYANLNEVMGVLSCVAQEFYRRVAAPYEDVKIRESGDIKGYDA